MPFVAREILFISKSFWEQQTQKHRVTAALL